MTVITLGHSQSGMLKTSPGCNGALPTAPTGGDRGLRSRHETPAAMGTPETWPPDFACRQPSCRYAADGWRAVARDVPNRYRHVAMLPSCEE